MTLSRLDTWARDARLEFRHRHNLAGAERLGIRMIGAAELFAAVRIDDTVHVTQQTARYRPRRTSSTSRL